MDTAERPAGVTVAAVVAILGSAGFILFAFVMARAGFMQYPASVPPYMPRVMRAMMLGMGFAMLGIAAWGITTAVGLFKMRNWARLSVLVFSALLLVMSASTGIMMSLVPVPPAPRASPQIIEGMRLGRFGFYAALALLGVIWLFYFNRAVVRARFASGPVDVEPGGRPLSITIIAWMLLIFGVVLLLFSLFSPFPGMFFGVPISGVSSRLFYVAYGAAEIGIGIGLLRLNPLSRVLAVAFFVLTILNAAVSAERPHSVEQLLASMPATFPIQDQSQFIATMRANLVPAVLINIVPIWFLIARRGAFNRAA